MTSCLRSAFLAVFFCMAVFTSFVDVYASEAVQDLGFTEIVDSAPDISNVSLNYEEILPEAWEGRGMSVMEVLSSLSGVQGYKQGGLGSFQSVSVRGISARNVIICIDGFSMNDASGGAFDLSAIDLNNIEKIEVYKDRVPARFGSSGLGAAINFVTKGTLQNGGKIGGRALLSYGSHDTFEGSLQVNARPTDSVSFSATASMRHSDNDYEFKNRNGTAYNTEDDFTDTRKNAEFTEYSGNVSYRILHAGDYFSNIFASILRTEAGNPGREDSQTQVASFTGESAMAGYKIETPELFDFMLLEMGIKGKFEKNVSASYYPLDKIGYNSTKYLKYGLAGYGLLPELLLTCLRNRFESTLRLAGSMERWEARGSVREFGLSRFSLDASISGEYAFTNWMTFFAEGSVLKTADEIDGGKFVMPTGTAIIEDASERNINMSLMGGIKLGKRDGAFGGDVSFGRFFRQPQLMELYGVYQGVLSNPNLKDETALRFNAGVFFKTPKDKSVFRVTYFESHIDNGIYWITSANLMKAFNVGKAKIRGVEVELSSKPVRWFETILRGTFQDPRDNGKNKNYNGKLLPLEPVRSYYVEGKFYLPWHFDLTLFTDYRTRLYSDRANITRQPSVAHYNATLGFSPVETTRFTFSLQNISNETYSNIYSPYPTPGLEYRIGLVQKF